MQVVTGGFTLDDTVLLDGRILRLAPGGNVLYAGVGAYLAGAQPALVAPVGDDYPQHYLDLLQRHGFDLQGVKRLNGRSIHMWALHEGPNRRQLVYWLDSGTNEEMDPRPEHFPEEYLHASGVHVAALPISTQEAILRLYDPARTVVSLDTVCIPGHIDVARADMERLLGQVTVFLPSQEEVRALWGVDPSPSLCKHLGRLGPRVVAIKLGDSGSMVWDRDSNAIHHIPACDVDAVDTTGAGDAYCGGFCATYANTRHPVLAAVTGTVAASFVITDFGGLHVLQRNRRRFTERVNQLLARVSAV